MGSGSGTVSGSGWTDVDRLEAALQARLAQVERESARCVFQGAVSPPHEVAVRMLGQAIDSLEEVGVWAAAHDASLTRMAVGMEKIEARSEALETEERNYAALRGVLESFLDEVLLSDRVVAILQKPDFDGDLEGVLAAVQQLTTVLQSKRLNDPPTAAVAAAAAAAVAAAAAAAAASGKKQKKEKKEKKADKKDKKSKAGGADGDASEPDNDDTGAKTGPAAALAALSPLAQTALIATAPARAAAAAAEAANASAGAGAGVGNGTVAAASSSAQTVSLAGLASMTALHSQRLLYRELQLSFTARADAMLRAKIDELAKWGAQKIVSEAQVRREIANDSFFKAITSC